MSLLLTGRNWCILVWALPLLSCSGISWDTGVKPLTGFGVFPENLPFFRAVGAKEKSIKVTDTLDFGLLAQVVRAQS